MMSNRASRGPILLVALAALVAGCVELDVVNPNQPDRERALANPADVQSLISGMFNVWYTGVENTWQVSHTFANIAEMNTTSPWWSVVQLTAEPREQFNNAPDVPNFTGPRGPRALWASMNQVLSTAHDGLTAIRGGMKFTEGSQDVTARARAYAKFMQGMAWGYQAMIFDQGIVIPETEALQKDVVAQIVSSLKPHKETLAASLAAFDEAIAISKQTNFNFPAAATSRSWFASPVAITNQDFVKLASTMAARMMVLSARTPQERAQLDWSRVLRYTSEGMTSDFGTILEAGFRTSFFMGASQGVAGTAFCCYRLDYRLVGPADVSGRYQAWIAAPFGQREPFPITTPDRRVTGATSTSSGSYIRYRSTHTGFNQADGLYRFSFYQWGRHAIKEGASVNATSSSAGVKIMATADENRLLRAEALLRTNDRAGAATLINVTRTRAQPGQTGQNLPAVTAAGVVASATCVPKTDAGACGDLMAALMYERRLELIGLDPVRGYAEARGFGVLPDGTWLHQPVPGNELDLIRLPNYTFGGVGGVAAAVYNPAKLQ